MSERQDERDAGWPPRPWIMAAICAAAGLLFHFLVDHRYPESVPPLRQAAATFVAIAAVSFVLTVERRRWLWSLAFAAGWALVIALVGWFTAQYNQEPTIFEWPYLSGIFAVLLAAPLFQTLRDEGAWRFPYPRLHTHAWTDAVIGAASLAFTGLCFLLAWLIAGLFDMIGIELLKDLLQDEWFAWMLAGAAFGGAVGLLRERDALMGTLQRLVMVVLSVLAPVLAAALVIFLVSLVFTGLAPLWDSDVPTTPLLLLAGAGAILLANAVIGNGREERSGSAAIRWSALALVGCVLPLALLAAASMGQRVGQYGWTPERIWGVIAVAIAIAYGAAGWWAILKARRDFDDPLRPMQTAMAIGLCGLALFLALPILDFGAISARSQLARLQSGSVEPAEFDWAAMAFDFGPAGRSALQRIARTGGADERRLASDAMNSDQRYEVAATTRVAQEQRALAGRIRTIGDVKVDERLRRHIAARYLCRESVVECVVMPVDSRRVIVIASYGDKRPLNSTVIDVTEPPPDRADIVTAAPSAPEGVDLGNATIELRPVERRQLFVNGEPVGEPFE